MKCIRTKYLAALLCCLPLAGFAQEANQKAIDDYKATVPRLSPIPVSVVGSGSASVSLNGQWSFHVDNSKERHPIQVPGEWELQGYKVNDGEIAVYNYDLAIPAEWKSKRIKLRFDGISSHAVVKVNDQKLAEHEGSFVPFEVDITPALKEGKNILQVEVQALTISDILACTSQYAVHTVGGILRNVTLFALPEANISGITIATTFDKQFKNAALAVHTSLSNESSSGANLSLIYILRDKNGKIIEQQKSAAKNIASKGDDIVNDILKINAPIQWNPEHPYLYTLYTSLYNNGKLVQSVSNKIGFRQVEVKGAALMVNGRPVKLHGVNRHSIYPLTGRSISDELDIRDAVLFREGNCNYIRTSHYPPSETFLNACDSLGLFVESESSLCWIQHGASPIWKKWNYLDEQYLPYMVQANVEKVMAQRNHASVVIWSLGNESRWSPLWAKVNDVVKKLDPSRPTTFHDQCWGGYNNAGSKADIAVYHYPGINGGSACDTMTRPVLFGEYAHVSCYSRRELISDPGVREAYGAPLAQMYDSMYHHANCLGGAIWSGIDDIFHMPDGRIIGYGPWGPIDAWRRAKPEYYGMKKAYTPIKIKGFVYPTEKGGTLTMLVENRYDFTSMNEVAIQYSIDGVLYRLPNSNIAPHASGTIDIPVSTAAKEVRITFTDPRGFVVNEEKVVLKPDPSNERSNVQVSAVENDAAITVRQGNLSYLISKMTGIIVSAKKNDKVILAKGPVFGVVPMNYEDGDKPNVAGETYQNNIYPIKNYSLYTLFAKNIAVRSTDDSVLITMDVAYYDGSSAKQSYCFSKDGTVTTLYEVQYKGNDTMPRQYGMMMQLPLSYDKLTWKRKGDFSVYPANDIGRTEGFAMMNAKHLPAVEEWGAEPKNEYKDDANDLGSNDFRSTKRHIYNASLTDAGNEGIHILSDATQSVRSWLQDAQIQLLVADYSNNGSEPYYGSPHTFGQVKIKNKTLKGKLVFRVDQ